MRLDPGDRVVHAVDLLPLRQAGAVDHEDRNIKPARGLQLGPRAGAAGVLGNDQPNPVFQQQGAISLHVKRAFGNDNVVMWQGRRTARRVDQPQQVVVLRLLGKARNFFPTNGQKDPLRVGIECGDRAFHVRRVNPGVAGMGLPRRPGEREQRSREARRRKDRVLAHRFREGMGRVDDMRHPRLSDIVGQPIGPAEPANPCRDRQRLGQFGAPGIGVDRLQAGIGDRMGQKAGFGRPAEDKKDGACGHG